MPLIAIQGTTLHVSGAMTLENVTALLDESATAFTAREMEFDLAAVSDVDSTAVSLLFEWQRRARDNKTRLTFTHLPPNLVRIATLYGVLELIPQYRSAG
ncbi:MAG: STAS domain-containing protein [Methylobacillus sp.]|jgi:phospholipid transport system transporter-binding protein|nr:STAS domain-containing protein [Methylobacillus sp.]